ncbi:obscurin isoform X11 [Paralichthys olivaceus]|uniref:obscurin isoform X11 n=1 Tax=Paralichthys olivaceus TaxID=8255 RepID=UPI0037500A77
MDVFGGAPRFFAYPRPVVVQSGTDAVLKCQIGGDPRPAVIWERNNEKIDPQGRYRVFEDGNIYNLIISAVTMEDSGQYICKAKNSIGETYAAATLKVEGEAQEMELREENKPRFLIKPLSTRAGRGEDAVFSCKLWGKPRPEVVWEKDGRKLNEIFESTHFSVGYQDGGWFQLKIFKTRAPDGGVYTCKARNEFGESLAGAVLLVDAGPGHEEEGNRNGYTNGHWKAHQGKQRIGRQVPNRLKDDTMTKSTKVKMFAVTEGKHAKFRCFVTGKPKPEIIWRKDGRLILSGRRYLLYEDREGYFTLKVLYCKQKDNGVYVCAASNTAGQTLSAVHLSVKEPPVRFKQPLIDLEVWERDLAVLECEVPEDSVAITWYLEDRRLQPGAKYGMEEWGTKRRLTIRDIGVDDDGIYLCEMPDGGRSIAEVAVKGTIMRKLPRKVDVLEGENAAFCVEVEKEEMDIHWYKDGTELRETHQTILKSFGRTHILVFVNTMPQDAGLVTFLVARSKTSSQLRVKAARHCPPSCPVGVQINTERANAALLSWVPSQDSRKNPPSGYVLERQEVGTGSQEWLQCLTTDTATSVEILGDSVPCEADYRFRICSVNKYGKSNNVEFPRAVHLVPVARIQAPLQDALVPEGQDAIFSIELSASVIGTWFLSGTQLQEDERFFMRRSRTHQSLRIRGVRDTDNGAEITFIAYGIRDSAALYIQAPLVKFSSMSEMDRNKFVEIGNPIVLYCELSDPAAAVHWYKNGVLLQTMEGLHIQSEGTMRRIVIQSAEFSHSGVYCCDAIDDIIRFNVEVEAPPVRFSAIPDAERTKTIQTGCPIVLQCELSDPSAQVYWYKDGSKLHPQNGVDIQNDGLGRTLIVHSAEFFHSGLYCCKTKGDAITFSVDIKAPPVKFSAVPEDMRTKSIEAGCPIVLQCVVSDPEAHVCWYKDEVELISNSAIEIHSEGNTRTIVVQSAELCHSGVYRCTTLDDIVEFHVEIKAIPVTYSTIFDVERTKSLEAGKALELECEVADSTGPVCWYKDGVRLLPENGWDILSTGTLRRLIIPSAELLHSGLYSCETSDGTSHYTVDIKAPTLPLSPSPDLVEMQSLEATCPTEPTREPSDPAVQVSGQRDKECDSNTEPDFETEAIQKTLVIEPTHPSNSGAYYCATADDVAQLIVKNQVPSPKYQLGSEVEKTAEECCPIVQQFEISDPIAKACWYKDGTQIYPKKEADFESQSSSPALPLQSHDFSGDERVGCETTGDARLNVDMKGGVPQCICTIKNQEFSYIHEAHCFLFGFVQTAEQCHYGDEIGEIAEASSQYTVDVEATSPRLSSDQEKIKSTEETFPLSSKWNSGIFGGETGDAQTYEDHSRQRPTSQSTYEYSSDWIKTEQSVELSDNRQTNRQSPVYPNSAKPTIMQSDKHHHTPKSTESQGEEFINYIRHAEGSSDEFDKSLQTDVWTDKLRNCLQTTTGELEEIYSSIQKKTIQSNLGNPLWTSTTQSEHFDNSFQISTVKSDKFCNALKTADLQSEETVTSFHSATDISEKPFKAIPCAITQSGEPTTSLHTATGKSEDSFTSLHTATVQSEDPFKSTHCAITQSDDLFTPLHTATVQSEKPFESLQCANTQSEGPPTSLQAATFQPEEPCTLLYIATGKSEDLFTSLHTATIQSEEPFKSTQCAITQSGDLFTPLHSATVQSEKPFESLQFAHIQSEEPPTSLHAATVQSEEPCTLLYIATGKSEDSFTSLHTATVQSEKPFKSPQCAYTQSDEPPTSLCAATVQSGKPCTPLHMSSTQSEKHFTLLHSATIQSKEPLKCLQTTIQPILPIQSEELDSSMQTSAAPSEKPLDSLLTETVLSEGPCNSLGAKNDQSEDFNRPLPILTVYSEKLSDFPNTTSPQSLDSSNSEKAELVQTGKDYNIRQFAYVQMHDHCNTGLTVPKHAEVISPSMQASTIQAKIHHAMETTDDQVDSTVNSEQRSSAEFAEPDYIKQASRVQSDEIYLSRTCESHWINSSTTNKVAVEALPVTITTLCEAERNKSVEAGEPIVLQCEVSDPNAQVTWYKDGIQLHEAAGQDMVAEGSIRTLAVQSAMPSHAGIYSCKTTDDAVQFHVDVKAPLPEVSALSEADQTETVVVDCPVSLQCELSEPTGQVRSYTDGTELLPQSGVDFQSEGILTSLVVPSAEQAHTDVYPSPPVTFADIPEEELFKSVVEREQLVLSCDISRTDGVVQWYKDGAEMKPSNNVSLQTEGTRRDLTIHSAQLSDTGTYTCRAGDHVLIFKVTIREPPVMIIYPKEDVHLDRHVPDEIILSCELSRANGVVSWYKDGQKLQDSENIKLKIEGPYRRLKIISSRVDDSGEYVCDTADDSIFFHLCITEPPVRIVSPSQSQMELCQQTSERMVLSCEISRPNAAVRWYRDGLEVEENENLILEVDGVYRRLIIPETTVKDSAEYVCDTVDDSMTFFVNIAEPPVRFIRARKMASRVEKLVGETLVLDCEVSRSNAEVIWKKNGEEVEDSRNITILDDGVMRQLTIHSLTEKDAGQYVCDAKDDVMDFSVKVQELPVKILGKTEAKTEKQFLVSDDIILVCELSRSNVSVSWYKDNHLIDDTERYCIEEQGVFRSLVVLNAGLQDSGEYTCDALDDKMVFYITVKEPPVQIIGNSGHPENHILVAGDDLILECEVSRPNATVQWLWNGEILKPDPRIKIASYDVVRKLVLSGLQPSDSGKYICDAVDDKVITIVEVQEPPAMFLNKEARNISAYENESVTLSAIVSRERANARWLKDGQLLNEDNIHISSEGNTHKLTINPLQLSDSGEYVCDINTDEMYFTLLVKEMKVKFIRPVENIVCLKGSSLTLRCEINKPKGDVQWLKNGQEIPPSRRHTIRAQGRERSFTIHQIVEEDAGEYTCESTDDRTSSTVSVEAPRVVEFIAELRNITIREGEDAVFKCVVSPEDTQLVWRLNGKQVALNERTVISSNGLCHMLCIHNCMVSDSGRVTADAEGLVSEAELQVQEEQVLFTKKMTPVVAEEYSEALLEVEVSVDSEEVQWMRQGVLIHPDAKYTLKHKGQKHSLTIHKLAMSDRGTYSCETLHDRTQAQLTVEPRKITIQRGLTDITTTERETASFEVELSHPNVPGTWMRNRVKLKPTNHFRMSAKGRVHSLTISHLSVEDTGTFMFCVENLKTTSRLVVKEPPVTIFRKLEDQKFSDGVVISIECELSRHNVDVKWLKNGVELKPSKELRIYAMGRKRFLQIMKCHVSDSGMYTCDAGDATTSCTVEVYERELLIVQALEDLDIQEDQNAVFVCEISVEDVPGEWYKNGEQIQPTSTIKIRQEGTKHFLLMCNVRPEDSGEIKFVARHVESVAHLEVEEIPVNIVKPLQDKTVLEKTRGMLDCAVSNSRCSIRWYKGCNVILPSERFEISSEGCYRKLIIQQVVLDDEGIYSVQVGEHSCSAKLTVETQSLLMVRELRDVEVVAPDDASFECEVSAPVAKAPVWSLKGEPLQPGSRVRLEKMGTVHRLTLRQTAPEMSGEVEFTSGKAKSSAQLRVLSDA